ncbi:hypothetical protein [Bacteroides sp. An19]|uniref:hypothetical protein n=1 Tax=Bacteroides sp. An19 TaxID=1965580 RepID=UPI001120A059|nr:hypothetical protein [Bacteroides sp. An19]
MRIFLSLYTWRCGLGVRCQYLLHCFWMRQLVSPDAVSCFPVSIYLRFQSSIASTAVLIGQDCSPCWEDWEKEQDVSGEASFCVVG